MTATPSRGYSRSTTSSNPHNKNLSASNYTFSGWPRNLASHLFFTTKIVWGYDNSSQQARASGFYGVGGGNGPFMHDDGRCFGGLKIPRLPLLGFLGLGFYHVFYCVCQGYRVGVCAGYNASLVWSIALPRYRRHLNGLVFIKPHRKISVQILYISILFGRGINDWAFRLACQFLSQPFPPLGMLLLRCCPQDV